MPYHFPLFLEVWGNLLQCSRIWGKFSQVNSCCSKLYVACHRLLNQLFFLILSPFLIDLFITVIELPSIRKVLNWNKRSLYSYIPPICIYLYKYYIYVVVLLPIICIYLYKYYIHIHIYNIYMPSDTPYKGPISIKGANDDQASR